MSAIVNSDCTTITLTVVPSLNDTVTSSTLTIAKDGSTVATIDSPDANIVLLPADVDQTTTTFCDGIYCFTLNVSYDTGTQEESVFQAFVYCELICDIVKAIADNPVTDIPYLFEAIVNASNCEDCDCETANKLYTILTDKLNDITDSNECTDCS